MNRAWVVKAWMLGAAVGFLAATVSSCGNNKQPPVKCNSTTCSTCCDATGTCLPGNTVDACGTGGITCQMCNPGKVCNSGQCVTGTANDGGTGGGSGGGVGGGSGGGAGGGTGGGTNVDGGSCDRSNCLNGCCTSDGLCILNITDAACGKGAVQCAPCGSTQTCDTQLGVCKAANCSDKCIDVAGNCIGGPTDDNACGNDGKICKDCSSTQGSHCVNGQCMGGTCNATTCPSGCCDGNNCVGAQSDLQCGINGVQCQSCNGTCDFGTGTCMGGGTDSGFPFDLDGGLPFGCQNCQGCCFGGLICMPGNSAFACGTGGANCAACDFFSLEMCVSGTCQ